LKCATARMNAANGKKFRFMRSTTASLTDTAKNQSF
jgi:hypothetical protein